MDYKNIISIKTEERNEKSSALCSLVQGYPFCVKVKEESMEGIKQEFFQDPLTTDRPNFSIKEDPELQLEVDVTGYNFFQDPLTTDRPNFSIKEDPELQLEVDVTGYNSLEESFVVSESTVSIKQDPELNLEPEETENFETDSERCAPVSSRMTNITIDPGSTAFQETCLLEVTDDKLDIAEERSTLVVGSGSPRQALVSQEDNALYNRDNTSLKENDIHDFTCSSCKQTFLSKYNLIRHVFIHIDGVQPPAHICMMCGEVFLTLDSLNKHSMVQAGISGKECQQNTVSKKCSTFESCEVMCIDKRQLKCDISKKTLTRAYRFRPRTSDIRGDSYSKSGHIKRSTVRPAGDGLLICDFCGKSFTVLYYFKRHALTHTGDRPHKCSVCGKSYTVSDSLKRHLITHTGERSHKCHVCGKTFITSDTLKKHVLIHTGERPHKCDVCGKSFTERSSLRKHELTHTGKRPHKCHICGKSFTQSGSLNKHVVKHIGKGT